MRVKLSYSVEEEDVLAEAAKMLNLSSDRLQEAIELFQAIQQELGLASNEDSEPNIQIVLDKLEELRKWLLEVDTRTAEVGSVVTAYDDYRRAQRSSPSEPEPPEESNLDDAAGNE